MKTIKAWVSGRVQGVGFRYFVQETAAMYEIAGYVRNLSDGRVEFLLQGDEQLISRSLERIKEGPTYAKVDSIDYAPMEDDELKIIKGFEIRY